MNGKHATISDLVRVHACPVRYCYERNDPIAESDRYAVCKQLSYHLGKALEPEAIWGEVVAVCPAVDPAMREFLDLCITACTKTAWKPAVQTDVTVTSQKQGMAGMIDRIDASGAFSIVRASGAMPMGTYAADRLRVAAIAFCLEEMTGKEVEGGFVEYLPDGISRYHAVQPRDRRQVIAALHKLREIQSGAMPQHPLNAPCNRCKFKEKCESSVGRRLSELL
ncbi:CRISPR-associated protein Cas4 [Methanoregula sp.]|uniref:CRISPR-associated protein Cas4 n=1 Tax=Methanoregula sp. TaxID=2052170 RepID=UPI003C1AF2D3